MIVVRFVFVLAVCVVLVLAARGCFRFEPDARPAHHLCPVGARCW